MANDRHDSDRMVDVPGGRLRVRDEGTGRPLLLVHAGVARLEAWDRMVGPLTAAGFRVIRPDLRGFGESTAEDVEFTHDRDLVAVLDAAGVGRALLVGNSMGGMASYDTAVNHPDRVVGVVGVAAGLPGYDEPMTDAERVVEQEYDALESLDPPDPDRLAAFEAGVWADGPGQPRGRAEPWIWDAVYEWSRVLNQPDRVAGHRAWRQPLAAERLGELTCPVLAVAGTLDFTGVAHLARHLEAAAPNARAVVWDDVAHIIGMEQPERLAAEVVAFADPLGDWG